MHSNNLVFVLQIIVACYVMKEQAGEKAGVKTYACVRDRM